MAQTMVAPALTNIGGIFFSIINLFINLLIVGIVVLFLNFIIFRWTIFKIIR